MTDVANAILDAAERRMRRGGFYGFSYREIAADVGVKSSSVHYHFPAKEDLAAAVVARYTDRLVAYVERTATTEAEPLQVWLRAFRATLAAGERPCPCPVLGTTAHDLPPAVALEVRRFFTTCQAMLASQGLEAADADLVLSTSMGAMIIAGALGDLGPFDRATGELVRMLRRTEG